MKLKRYYSLLILLLLIEFIKCFEKLFQGSKKTSKANKQHNHHHQHTTTTYYNNSLQFYSTVIQPVKHKPLNYCSFFNNRAPSPQVNLKNCTWYKENSCCLQSEIESTFSKVKPLIGSSELCQQYLNNLMCYICAPNQFRFYGKERLTVCVQFCNQMYDACAEAILKGYRIAEIYSNGSEFCLSRRYNVEYKQKDNCFFYVGDHNRLLSAASSSLFYSKRNLISFFCLLLTIFFIFFTVIAS